MKPTINNTVVMQQALQRLQQEARKRQITMLLRLKVPAELVEVFGGTYRVLELLQNR